jgi:hypothetical protein
MSINEGDLEFENGDDSPSSTEANNDDKAMAEVLRHAAELERDVREFRKANNIPDSMALLIRRNPKDGSRLMEAVSSALEGAEKLVASSEDESAISLNSLGNNKEKE